MYAAHLCSTNEKMSKCKGRNSEAYSNLLPVFQFTLVFKGLFYTLIAMCSLNGRDISKITQDRFKHNFAWMHNQIDGTWRKPLLDARLNRGGNKETVHYLVMV